MLGKTKCGYHRFIWQTIKTTFLSWSIISLIRQNRCRNLHKNSKEDTSILTREDKNWWEMFDQKDELIILFCLQLFNTLSLNNIWTICLVEVKLCEKLAVNQKKNT